MVFFLSYKTCLKDKGYRLLAQLSIDLMQASRYYNNLDKAFLVAWKGREVLQNWLWLVSKEEKPV